MLNKEKLAELSGPRFAEVRADSIDVKNRTAEFVISSEAVDTYGTVFKASGGRFDRYRRNPIVFYQHASHETDPDLVIGISEIRVEDSKTIGKAIFEPADLNPVAEKVFRKIQAGTLRGASISAMPLDARWGDESRGENPDVLYFTEWELREWSVVAMPSNPEALARSQKAFAELKAEKTPPAAPDGAQIMSRFNARIKSNLNRSL